MSYEDNGRRFMKVFLIDGSVNGNEWGVKPESIPSHINTAIGKPIVMFKNALGQFDHPPLNDKDLSHALAYQDLFRVGTFIDVQEDIHKPGTWWGIAEITDENFKKAVKEDPSVPFYVSPTIALSSPFQNDQQITDWTFMHSAIVDRPAFGIHKAYVGSHCAGDKQTCLLQLRKASIEKNGLGCGFCTYKAAKQLQATIKSSGNIKTVSSYDSIKQTNQSVTSKLTEDNNANNKSEVVTERTTQVKTENQPTGESQKTTVEQQTKSENNTNNNNSNNNTQSASIPIEEYQRALTKVKEYELKLQSMSADKDSLQTIVGKLNDEVGKLKEKAEMEAREARHNTITELVQRSAVYQGLSNEDKQKQVENFEKSSFTLDDIKGVLGPIEQNFKKASLGSMGANYSSRLQLGPNKSISGPASTLETKSASSSTGNTEKKIPEWMESMMVQFQSEGGA